MSQPAYTSKDSQENAVESSKKNNPYPCKKFQEETANRIVEMFETQPRVLLADEVGLGKTIVARRVIELLNERKLEKEHENFKVFYYCSNMTLASQNQAKLSDEFNDNHEKSISVINQRLSMVHWLIAPNKDGAQNLSEIKKDSPVILYQTPQTSLENGRRQGVVNQRALMYAILKDFFQFRGYNTLGTMAERLRYLLDYNEHNGWDSITDNYEGRFENVQTWYRKNIYSNLKDKMEKTFLEQESLLDFLKDYLNGRICRQYSKLWENYDVLEIIKKLRVVFAQISIDLFNPDLVILDEFQRYDDLIDMNKRNENLLFDSMINNDKTRVLLLSATPYTPYTMKADLSQNQKENHYKEFMNLIRFLMDDENKKFEKCWESYSGALNKLTMESMGSFKDAKTVAEKELYSIICRTERRNDKNIIKQNEYSLNITEKDVLSWINIKKIVRALSDNVEADNRIIDYIKSSPYLLSFMGKTKCNYSLYEKIQNYYTKAPAKRRSFLKDFSKDKTSFIPVKNNESFKFGSFNLKEKNNQPKEKNRTIQTNNARLQLLIDTILPEKDQTELLLWVPASQPYYDASSQKGSGVKHPVGDIFSKNKGFSKILVFSHWTMVPPMTSAMVSFEADRRIFKHGDYNIKNEKNKRIVFSIGEDTRNLLAYPSKKLADIDIYKLVQNPENKTLDELALEVSEVIKDTILKPFLTGESQQQKAVRWSLKGYLAFLKYIDRDNNDNSDKQISVPQDAAAVLAWLAIASPGVCALRTLNNRHWTDKQTAKIRPELLENDNVDCNSTNNKDENDDDDEDFDAEKQPDKNHDKFKTAQEIASAVVSIFNHDSKKLIDNAFKKSEMKDAVMCKSYAFRVARYCAEGNLQAVMDELAFQCQTSKEFYDHFVYKIKNNRRQQTDGYSEETDANEISQEDNSLRSCLAPKGRITVQTRNSFLYPKSTTNKKYKPVVFRTGFALALSQTESTDQSVMHSERIRKAFNSPFHPFVLSTTSIGQDGLDFHAYCRKVMHWNLPGNPIDLEQREGRINRYLSLAIRQSLANSHYADEILQKEDSQNTETPSTCAQEEDVSPLKEFWKKLVEKVADEDNGKNGEMVPYWILPEDFEFKYPIERIVPMYPHSKDQSKYEWIINILSKYRLTLGQPDQEKLINILNNLPEDRLTDPDLYFNLSPFFRK